jgi:hypothetical protein
MRIRNELVDDLLARQHPASVRPNLQLSGAVNASLAIGV